MISRLRDLFKRDTLLNEAVKESFQMLELGHKMFKDARECLREKEIADVAHKIYEQDVKVNKYERAVRRKVFSHLALSGVQDLSAGLILITVITDIERLGDYVKNIVELSQYYPSKLEAGKFEEDLQKIELSIEEMFITIKDALRSSDVEKARDLMNNYYWIIKRCDGINNYIISNTDCVLTANTAVTLTLYFRYLKRISAHIINVASSIVNPFYRIGYKEKPKEETYPEPE